MFFRSSMVVYREKYFHRLPATTNRVSTATRLTAGWFSATAKFTADHSRPGTTTTTSPCSSAAARTTASSTTTEANTGWSDPSPAADGTATGTRTSAAGTSKAAGTSTATCTTTTTGKIYNCIEKIHEKIQFSPDI